MESLTIGHGDAVVYLGNVVPAPEKDPYAGGSFDVELRSAGLLATRTVFTFGFDGFDDYLAGLAEQWKGWSGMKSWRSPEADLAVDATFESGGHVVLRFIVQDGPVPSWRAQLDVQAEAGAELTSIASDVSALLSG